MAGASLYTLNVTCSEEQLKSCTKLSQTGRLKTELDTDSVYYIRNCKMASTRECENVIAQSCSAVDCV